MNAINNKTNYRTEKDSISTKKVPANKYYGIQTARAIENFPISKTSIAEFHYLIRALAVIKEAAAITNKKQKTIKPEIAEAIIQAAKEVQAGKYNDQFPVDAMQGGAGTSTNMNMNEVVANRSLELLGHAKGEYEYLHPNNHVNASQSTNDVYPTTGKIAIIWYCQDLMVTLKQLRDSLIKKSKEFKDVIKTGRTHIQDATPITLGREFKVFGATINDEIINLKETMKSLYVINMGGTAIGTGINSKPGYSKSVISTLAKLTSLPLIADHDLMKATSSMSAFSRINNSLKEIALTLIKIASDLQLLTSGLQDGFADIILPAVQPGSTIMPGKINPVIPEAINQACFQVIGNSTTLDLAVSQGHLQANVYRPIIFYNIMQSTLLLNHASEIFRIKCIDGITTNKESLYKNVKNSVGLAAALIPYIGYDKAAEIAKESKRNNISVAEAAKKSKLIKQKDLKKILNPANMINPNVPLEKMVE